MEGSVTNSARGLWISLCLCFFAVCLFSESAAAFERHHDCGGGDCPVCLLTRGTENFFRVFTHAEFFSGFSLNIVVMAAFILRFIVFIPLSSVRLKVRLNR
jgi:hypothetical protein